MTRRADALRGEDLTWREAVDPKHLRVPRTITHTHFYAAAFGTDRPALAFVLVAPEPDQSYITIPAEQFRRGARLPAAGDVLALLPSARIVDAISGGFNGEPWVVDVVHETAKNFNRARVTLHRA